jgi:DNA modification methylase
LDELLDDLGRIPGDDVDDPGAETSRAEELQEEWDTERGQLWQVGRHRLLCGDATEEGDVERLLDGAEPRLMVTDPPYGVEYEPEWRKGHGEGDEVTSSTVPGDGRSDWGEAYTLFPGNVIYTWSPAGRDVIKTGETLESIGFEIRSQIIWAKPFAPLSRAHYAYRHEPCWYAVNPSEANGWSGGKDQNTLWDGITQPNDAYGRSEEVNTAHSTQKPVECHARPIRNHEGDVYEPFCGSGTGIIAAEQEGRTCYAMEIDPAYCAVILERCSEAGMETELIE